MRRLLSIMKCITKRDCIMFLAVILILGTAAGCSKKDSGSKKEVELSPVMISKGEKLYNTNCVKCHGVKGVGERPDDIYAPSDVYIKDEDGKSVALPVAPPLNDSAHAWHHTDEALVDVILNGSPRNPRMIQWKTMLSEDDAKSLLAYIKSLWSAKSLACQGPKHMSPDCQAEGGAM